MVSRYGAGMNRIILILAAALGLAVIASPPASGHTVTVGSCYDALHGANGDDDITAYERATSSTFVRWGLPASRPGSGHYADHRVVAHPDFMDRYGWMYENAYCLAQDGGIADRTIDAPSGW